MRRISAVVIVSLLISGMILYFEVGIENASAYTPHAPIYIDGNTDFANQSAIEGWAGDGSQSDPYIIEGYEIDASTAHGIESKNTDVFFVIRDCYIHDGGTSFDGIFFANVSYGEVWDSNLSYNKYGIANYAPSSNNIISNNIIESNNNWGIVLAGSSNTVINNSIHSNLGDGIWLVGSSNTIFNNSISNNYNGIHISFSLGDNIISNNRIYSNNYNGIYLDTSESNTISGNNISSNMNYGIYFELSNDNKIYYNNIIDNTNQAYDDGGVNSWSLSYPGGGNYWNDYIGIDSFKGPNQDIPGSDGFGDTPYTDIDGGAGAKDMYPLMSQAETSSGGGILITSHDDGDIVGGIVLVEAAVTFAGVERVYFYVNGAIMNFDDSFPYQYILNTNTLSEDTSFEIKAEAYLVYGYYESTSITLWVNNIVDIGSYITVSTLNPEYQPDEDASLLVTMVSPPYFDNLELDVNCVDPSGHPLYTSSHNFYYGSEFRVIMSIPSDAELGTYTVIVEAYGFAGDSLVWGATDSTTFLVSGTSLRNQFEELNVTLSSMDLTELLDEIEYLNQTIPDKIDDLLLQLLAVNDSILGDIADTKNTLLSQLNDLDDYVEGFNESLTDDLSGILSTLQSHDESTGQNNSDIQDKLDDLLSGGIETEALDDLKGMLTDLAGNVSFYNQSIADDIMDIVDDIDDFEGQLNQKINAMNATLNDLEKDIETAEEELQTSINEIPADKKEEEGFGLTEGLLIIVIILLVVILLVMLMGRREPKKAADRIQKEDSEQKILEKEEPVDSSPPEYEVNEGDTDT
jgi:parallel beta-helix repeat protein